MYVSHNAYWHPNIWQFKNKYYLHELNYKLDIVQRFYFDTSVFGGVFDKEFDEATVQLFERVKLGQIICMFSDLTETELLNAPGNVKEYFKNLPKEFIERVIVTDEILGLASKYIAEKVVGQTSFDDCIHIATATVNKADILVSWNFKHIVNVYRIRGYNSINIRSNYQSLEIRSPKEILEYEDWFKKCSKRERVWHS